MHLPANTLPPTRITGARMNEKMNITLVTGSVEARFRRAVT
jgi:hypothetical protein